ncbi:RrF2 family transcriptional regulator [Nocardiopsis composta]
MTKFTDLSLRAVMRLAASGGDEPLTTREVAEGMDVPYTHMAKAVTRLRELGVVEARRGRGGGLVLTPFGMRASLGWLVRELEGRTRSWSARAARPARCARPAGCAVRCARRSRPLRLAGRADRGRPGGLAHRAGAGLARGAPRRPVLVS